MRPMLRAAASRTAADRRVAGRRDVGGGGGAEILEKNRREKSGKRGKTRARMIGVGAEEKECLGLKERSGKARKRTRSEMAR